MLKPEEADIKRRIATSFEQIAVNPLMQRHGARICRSARVAFYPSVARLHAPGNSNSQ